jgi:hypothetical protein
MARTKGTARKGNYKEMVTVSQQLFDQCRPNTFAAASHTSSIEF